MGTVQIVEIGARDVLLQYCLLFFLNSSNLELQILILVMNSLPFPKQLYYTGMDFFSDLRYKQHLASFLNQQF